MYGTYGTRRMGSAGLYWVGRDGLAWMDWMAASIDYPCSRARRFMYRGPPTTATLSLRWTAPAPRGARHDVGTGLGPYRTPAVLSLPTQPYAIPSLDPNGRVWMDKYVGCYRYQGELSLITRPTSQSPLHHGASSNNASGYRISPRDPHSPCE